MHMLMKENVKDVVTVVNALSCRQSKLNNLTMTASKYLKDLESKVKRIVCQALEQNTK